MIPHTTTLTIKIWNNSQTSKFCWVLFFAHFQFTFHYWPGSKNTSNIKVDALSCCYSPYSLATNQNTILLSQCLDMGNSDQIVNLLPCHIPEGAFADCTFVPTQHGTYIITWAHTSLGTVLFGTQYTYKLLCSKYWWPNMLENISKFISLSTTCATSKVPHTFPTSKLQTLPIPSRPWSHLVISFITDPPDLQGNNAMIHYTHPLTLPPSSFPDWQT